MHMLSLCAEPFNCGTHLLGAVIWLAFGIAITVRRLRHGQGLRVSPLIFLISAVLLLSVSGIYHLLPFGSRVRHLFQVLDHAAIFALIAGSFTAVHDLAFTGVARWGAIAAAWLIASVCIIFTIIWFGSIPEFVSLSAYLAFGWLGVLSACALIYRRSSAQRLAPLFYGGVAYTVGAVCEFFQWSVAGIISPHEMFHVAVLAGIAFHWRFISTALKEHDKFQSEGGGVGSSASV